MDKRLNGQRIAPMVAALWFTWIVSLGIYAEDVLLNITPSRGVSDLASFFPVTGYYMPVTVRCRGSSRYPFRLAMFQLGPTGSTRLSGLRVSTSTADGSGSFVGRLNTVLDLAPVDTTQPLVRFYCTAEVLPTASHNHTHILTKQLRFVREHLVRVAPSMQFENIYVERQDSLDLSCNFTGYPKPRISWQFQHASWGAGYVEKEGLEGYTCIDHVYIVHSSLRISNFNASRHEGRYECTGRATLENGMAISDKGTFAVHLTDSYSNLLVGDLSTD